MNAMTKERDMVAAPVADGQPFFAVNDLHGYYGESYIVHGVSFSVAKGQILALLGRNGAGKTSTLRLIARADLPSLMSGEIWLDGQAIHPLPGYQAAQAGIQLVPEDRRIIQGLSVEENLILAQVAPKRGWDLERIYSHFPRLAERRNQEGVTLSGGEQQMLAIGRALMTNPKLLILDEATEGLAPLIREEIWNCLSMLKGRGQSVLVIDKNVANLAKIADRHYMIERGRTVWTGTSEQLLAEPDLQHRYLGI
jgi:branched-chain amino acid transport system ATP-binding protein